MIISRIHNLIIKPRNFFTENIQKREFSTKDLILTISIMVPLIMIVHIFEENIIDYYSDYLASFIYIIGYFFGLLLTLLFRTYIVRLMLAKLEIKIKFSKIGIVICLAMFTYILMYFIPILINTDIYNLQIEIIMKIWNLILIIIGVKVISNIKYIRATLLILIMIGVEYLVKLAFS